MEKSNDVYTIDSALVHEQCNKIAKSLGEMKVLSQSGKFSYMIPMHGVLANLKYGIDAELAFISEGNSKIEVRLLVNKKPKFFKDLIYPMEDWLDWLRSGFEMYSFDKEDKNSIELIQYLLLVYWKAIQYH